MKTTKIMLFMSSFAPLYVLIFLKILIDITQDNLSLNTTNIIILISCGVMFALGVCGIIFATKNKNHNEDVIVTNYQNVTEESYLSFFSLFVLFAISFEIEFISMFVVYIVVLIFVAVVYIKNEMYYINPFLNILGYSCFKVEIKYLDGTKKQIKCLAKSQPHKECILSNNIFLINK